MSVFSSGRRVGSSDAGTALGRHSGRSYWQVLTRAVAAAAVVHTLFGILFLSLGAPQMGWVNLGSVALYGVAWSLLRGRRNRAALVLIWVELLGHALVATRLLGWDSGFHYYVLLMVPLLFISPTRRLSTKLALAALLAAFYVGLDQFAHHRAPLVELAPLALDAVRGFNIVATFALLAHLANYYLGAVLRAERRLQELATTDVLTRLPNRRHGLEVAVQQLGRRRRDGTPLSLILGDVDHFKSVNDRFGHEAGDRLLAQVAVAMQAATRGEDTVCRWGGEEFLIVLPDTALEPALHVAERVRESVRALGLDTPDGPVGVTITLGVSTLRDGEALEDAIARADAAMYRGKLGGRNRCVAEAALVAAAPREPQALRA